MAAGFAIRSGEQALVSTYPISAGALEGGSRKERARVSADVWREGDSREGGARLEVSVEVSVCLCPGML